jgi:hypothetical protein
MRLAYLFASTLLVSACAETGADSSKLDGDEPGFTLGDPGKADGVLSSADKARVEAAFESVLASAEGTVQRLETEIAQLEADHAAKQAEADRLVMQIAAREDEIRRNFNTNLLLCAFFPSPACFLATALSNDSALRQYKDQLSAAQSEQQRIRIAITEYGEERDAIRARITPLREGKARVMAMLQGTTPHTPPAVLSGDSATAEAYWRTGAMASVQSAVAEEVRLLLELRDAAVELSNTLDQSLATLRSLEASVAELVKTQREQFMKLAIKFLTGDPASVAEDFLDQQIAAHTRDVLNQLSWPLNDFARYLASERGSGDEEALYRRLLDKLGSDAQVQPLEVGSTTAVNILDNTSASSAITIAPTRTAQKVEVHVSIEHTYIGDLVLSIKHGDKTWTLSDRVGGSADNLDKTFTLPDANIAVKGKWTLKVEDKEAQDTGKLLGWELIAY